MQSVSWRIGVLACAAVALATTAAPAGARTVANTKDGKPNIIVVMTDDQALADLDATGTDTATGRAIQAMPYTASLLTAQGTRFDNAVDSFPLCCPSRATFITGQYSHNHGVGGNFFPYGWYGMGNRANTLPKWLQNAGYYTAAVGKWLNGYGAGTSADKDAQGNALKAGGEKPVGFDNWNGAVDVSAYDYFNLALNQNGTVKYWGDTAYAKALNAFARIQVMAPAAKSIASVLAWASTHFGGTEKTIPAMFARAADPSTYGAVPKPGCDSSTNRYVTSKSCYSPDITAAISSSIVNSQKTSKKPFFLWWSPASPHREDVNGGIRNGHRNNVHYSALPGNSKKEDVQPSKIVPDPRPAPRYAKAVFDWSRITSKPSFDAAPTDKPASQRDNTVLKNPLATIDKQRLAANYNGRLASLKAVDDGLKKIYDTLKATKQLDNTLIILTSDNGWLQGEHRVPGDKFLPYEESIRVPLIMRGPGVLKGRRVTDLVTNIDFASTILEAAKATPGRTQDGVSLLGLAKGTSTIPARAIALEANAPLFADASMPQQWDHPYRGVRTNRWKYVVWCQKNDPESTDVQTCTPNGDRELYDLQSDPYELNNLAGSPAYSGVQADMQAKLDSLKSCVGVGCRIPQ